jgi:hypothetical protein
MAARAHKPVIETPQGPDPAIRFYHFWDIAHRIRHDPLAQYTTGQALEKLNEEEEAFLNLQTIRATTELGKALQLKAWAIYHGGAELLPHIATMLENRHDLIGPHSFEKLLGDFIAADKEYQAAEEDEDGERKSEYENRSNALFSLFATMPQTIGQAREILRTSVHTIRECELTVGGPLPDAIELALVSILDLLDRMDPAGKAVQP